jgi:hypothetical protein
MGELFPFVVHSHDWGRYFQRVCGSNGHGNTHTFFLGDEWKDDIERVVFYEVMTVLVGAFAVALVANAPEPDETMRCCRRGLPNFARCPTLATGRIA